MGTASTSTQLRATAALGTATAAALPNFATRDAPAPWRDIVNGLKNCSCDACLRGKAHAQSSDRHVPAVRAPGSLVSFDIWQASTPHINGGQRYAIVFTDQFSRFRRGYLLSKENDSAEALDRFVNFATSVWVHVKRLHRDGAGEFLDTDELMKQVLVKHNILGATSTSSAGIHRQNPVAERNNRTLQDGIRTRLIQANISLSFW